MPTNPFYVELESAVRRLHHGDGLLFRPTTREGKWIYRLSRGQESHVARAVQLGQKGSPQGWWVVEQIQPEGRLVPLIPYLLALPSGIVDVYRPNHRGLVHEYNVNGAVDWALKHIPGRPYGYGSIWKFLLSYAPFARWRYRPSANDQADGDEALVCSSAFVRSDRLGGGYDPIPNRADTWVTPGDITTAAFYGYRFTIVHDDEGGAT